MRIPGHGDVQNRLPTLCNAACGAVVLIALGSMSHSQAQGVAVPTTIYSCVDAAGVRRTSDRPIAECLDREQRLHNPDGSLKRMLPPTLTARERFEAEAREREAAIERTNRQDAIRRDRILLSRFPDEAAHRAAREAALDDVRRSLQQSQVRLDTLAAERKPLLADTEFYVGKPLPATLSARLDANDASAAAQRSLVQNQQLEVARIERLFDAELVRLKRLWSGAPVGSIGMTADTVASTPNR